ncbi:FAD-dependent oxidoreductase [Sphingobium sp.]|uniref:FAD-dependent oxidoreductase n=1 Tax=Sphingobium sp. TaxID=1912891 RepID=UPI003BB56D20
MKQDKDLPSTVSDVIVVGSGAAGMVTSIMAAQSGLSVTLLEKTAWIGGTTAFSGGGVWIPRHHHLAALGQTDSLEQAWQYLSGLSPAALDHDRVLAFLEAAPAAVAWLEAHTPVRFTSLRIPDYFPDMVGAVPGRTLLSRAYDGASLGDALALLRPPLKAFSLFGSMQIDQIELPDFWRAMRSTGSLKRVMFRISQYARDRIMSGRGRHLANGNALAASLLRAMLDYGVTINTQTPVTSLVTEDGRIAGAIVAGGHLHRARRGVILATGGFGASAHWVREHMPMPQVHVSLSAEGNVGDGLTMSIAAGGSLDTSASASGILAPVSTLRDRQGIIRARYPHFGIDRAKPGSLIVDQRGKRFANEASPYHQLVETMVANDCARAWLIGDARFVQRYGMGLARPFPFPKRHLVQAGYLHKAHSLGALAQKLDIDPVALEDTVARFNDAASAGVDAEFGRGHNRHDRSLGDSSVRPNPNLAPLDRSPFYAIALYPGSVSSTLGAHSSVNGEVLDAAGRPIAGLYVVGADQQSVFSGLYPSGGGSLGSAITSAYRSARHLIDQPG